MKNRERERETERDQKHPHRDGRMSLGHEPELSGMTQLFMDLCGFLGCRLFFRA